MKTIGIIIASHNSASLGILDTVQMIMGELSDVYALQLKAGEMPETMQKEMERYYEKYQGNCIFLIDLYGGSPFNALMKVSRQFPSIFAVCGVNVPMVLEAVFLRNTMTVSEMPAVLEERGKEGIINLENTIKRLNQVTEVDKDEEDD